ncbi:MAG TPA: TlpA disulfide reductase family protein [Pirellulaceae bacterium]|jgi:thiol-disulfide isomerase/thioredoxin|nr:TlpA disulfide reductase family protein [Pirellulaceae bacterium]
MTRSFPTLCRWLAIATCGAAFAFAVPYASADDPAPSTKEEAQNDSEDSPAEDAPEPEKSKGEKMFQEAIRKLQARHESQEQLADAIRRAQGILEAIVELPENDADAELREKATMLAGRMKLALLTYGTDEEKKELVPALVEEIVSAEELGPAQYSMMGNLLEASAQIDPKLAEETMATFETAIESKGDENGPEVLAQLEAVMRRATLLGEKLKLTGTTFKGKKFDIDSLKGKVVLVDFWATWCPPCRAEHPNMLANYRKYKEKGFEIVGVSLDQDREALTEYLEESEGDWIILHDGEGENPAMEYYAIEGIPTMFLLDEQGAVISTEARGEELTRLLEERWGKIELPEEESAEGSDEDDKQSGDAKPKSKKEDKEEASEDADEK